MVDENNLKYVTDDSFKKEVIDSVMPVLVDFWATWCGPCQALGPIFAEIAKLYKNKIVFSKLNVDDSTATSQIYSIKGIPAILLFKEGQVVATHVGILTKSQLINFIDNNI